MITFELVSLSGVRFGQEVYEVTIPTPDGIIAVFPHHMPLVSLVIPGVIGIRHRQSDSDEMMDFYAIHGGVVEIDEKRVRVLVDEADESDEIVAEEASAALDEAKRMAASAKDRKSFDKALQQIQLQQARIKVATLPRRKIRRHSPR